MLFIFFGWRIYIPERLICSSHLSNQIINKNKQLSYKVVKLPKVSLACKSESSFIPSVFSSSLHFSLMTFWSIQKQEASNTYAEIIFGSFPWSDLLQLCGNLYPILMGRKMLTDSRTYHRIWQLKNSFPVI